MYRITLESAAFNGPEDEQESLEYLAAALDMLIAWDTIYLLRHPDTPLLYDTTVRYEEEPLGAEFWRDIPTVLKYGTGDCLPLDTLVERADGTQVPLGLLKCGDIILGDDRKTTIVEEVATTGMKPVVAFTLDCGSIVRASPAHRFFDVDDREVRAEDLRVGSALHIRRSGDKSGIAAVEAIAEEPPVLMGDIQTDSGRFMLAETGVIAHNCEDLACWLIAEKRVRFGIPARPFIIPQLRKNGKYLYHIAVATPDAPGGVEDPSRKLGMGD